VPEVYRETLGLASQERVVLKNCKTRKKEKEGGGKDGCRDNQFYLCCSRRNVMSIYFPFLQGIWLIYWNHEKELKSNFLF
jgi:hypothetical protein